MKKLTILLLIWFPAMSFAQWNNDPSVNTKIADTIGMQVQPKVVVNDDGESCISWFSDNGGWQFDVYMQRLDENGNMLWDEDGLLISDNPTMTWTTDYSMVLDNDNNAILLTQDIRTGNSDVYAYSISPNGNFNWGADGIALTNDEDFNPSPKATVDREGNIVGMWEAEPADTTQFMTISLQKLSPDGNLLWNNVQIENDTAHCWMPNMITTEDTCTIVTWVETDKRDTTGEIGNWGFMHAFAQKIDANGNFLWDEPAVVDTINNMSLQPFYPSLASDGNGGLYVSWTAMANAFAHTCYVQHVSADGVVQWTANGVNVSDSTQFDRLNPHVVSMQENGMAVFWNEVRQRSDIDWEAAIMGQKLSSNGDRLWTTQGKLVDNWFNELDTSINLYDAKAIEEDFVLFFDHEYLVATPDTQFRTDLYTTRINADATPVWATSKIVFSNATSWKLDLVVSDASNDQWISAWEDNRNDPEHEFAFGVFAQNINVDGNIGPVGIFAPREDNEALLGIYPNPVNESAQIQYVVKSPGNVEIKLFNMKGRLAQTVLNSNKQKGTYTQQINTSGITAGVYLIRYSSPGVNTVKKLIRK